MKDKELRDLLIDSGIILKREFISGYGTYLKVSPIKEKLQAIIDYLGIEFKTPEKQPNLIAVKKEQTNGQTNKD